MCVAPLPMTLLSRCWLFIILTRWDNARLPNESGQVSIPLRTRFLLCWRFRVKTTPTSQKRIVCLSGCDGCLGSKLGVSLLISLTCLFCNFQLRVGFSRLMQFTYHRMLWDESTHGYITMFDVYDGKLKGEIPNIRKNYASNAIIHNKSI